jgi:hypothetical protein
VIWITAEQVYVPLSVVALAQRSPSTDDRQCTSTMPLQIGRPPDHNFTEPLGLLSDCHRRIEYFLGVLITVTGRTPGGLLTPAQCAALEAALAYFATASPKHTTDEEDSLFPRLRGTHDPAAKRALNWSNDSSVIMTLRKDTIMQSRSLCGDGSQTGASKGQRPRSCEDTLRLCERSISDTSMLRIASCSPRPLGYFPLRQIADIGREMAERRSGRVGLTT